MHARRPRGSGRLRRRQPRPARRTTPIQEKELVRSCANYSTKGVLQHDCSRCTVMLAHDDRTVFAEARAGAQKRSEENEKQDSITLNMRADAARARAKAPQTSTNRRRRFRHEVRCGQQAHATPVPGGYCRKNKNTMSYRRPREPKRTISLYMM